MKSELFLNIWSIISLVIAGQGVLLCFLLLSNKEILNIQKLFVVGLIGSFSTMLIYYALFWSGFHLQIHRIFNLPLSFVWGIGPFSYLIGRSLKNEKISPLFYIHFLPLAFFCMMRIVFSFFPIENVFINNKSQFWFILIVLQLAQLLFYIIIINKDVFGQKNIQPLQKVVGVSYNIYVLGYLSYYILIWANLLKPELDYFLSLIMAISIYAIGHYCYHFRKTIKNSQKKKETKYANSMLSTSVIPHLLNKLTFQIKEEKIYLTHELNLETLAEKIGISKHQASQLINQEFNENFFDFINKHRIEYAKLILSKNEFPQLKINQLAIQSGFNNKVTFNNAFKKFTGMTATAYKNSLKSVKL